MIDITPFLGAGLVPMPTIRSGKCPAKGFSQAAWYRNKPSREEVEGVWARYGPASDAVSLICGHGIELIDIDVKNDPEGSICKRYLTAIKEESPQLFERLVVVETGSGGAHLWLRLDESCEVRRSTALAQLEYSPADQFILATESKMGVVIETRGEGGYGLCPPSEGYSILQGDLFDMPAVNAAERELLWDIARSFNTYVKAIEFVSADKGSTSGKPGEDFSTRVSNEEIIMLLNKHGWTTISQRGSIIYLNRPGAPHRHTSGILLQDKRLFVNYSTSVADFVPGAGYSYWRLYAIMEHGSDFSAAAKTLSENGYGDQQPSSLPAIQKVTALPADILSKYDHLRFSPDKVPDMKFNMFVVAPPKNLLHQPVVYGVSFPGAIIPIVGKQKSRKSTVLTGFMAGALSGVKTLRVQYDTPKKVLWIDTEQPEFYFWKTQWRILVQSWGMIDNLYSYWFRKMSPKERMDGIMDLVNAIQPDVLVIDGINDLFKSMNKEEVIVEFVDQWLMPIADMGITIHPVLHLNKGDGNMAGWVGTVLAKKSDGTIQVDADPDNPYQVIVRLRDARAKPFPAYVLRTEEGMHGVLYDMEESPPDYNYDSAIDDGTGTLRSFNSGTDDTYRTEPIESDPITDEDIPF